ncbi:MAG: YeiH family protein [Actinobacteria bacterium]|nr:YeiH family protein [Actinomycetota bacterium]
MSVSEVSISTARREFAPWKTFRYIPGIALLLAVGYAGKIVANYVPHTEYVIWAIAIGMVIRNVIVLPQAFVPGIATYELWLKTGIVLMGVRLAIQSVAKIGATGLFLVLVEIAVSVLVALFLARFFKLSEKLGNLIGVGVGICGVSAIIGTVGAIDAKEEDSTYAIATILIFGAVMVFLLPLVGKLLGMSDQVFGFWSGLSVDNTAETVATGFAYSEGAGKVATVVKLSRNALMGFVILLFALVYARRGLTAQVQNKATFLWSRFPKFLLGFLAASILVSLGTFTPAQVKAIDALSKWAFLLTFAGVGLATQFSKMRAGIKPFLVGLGVETAVTLVNLVMVMLVIR